MKKYAWTMLTVLLFASLMCQGVLAEEYETQYYNAVSKYFKVSKDDVANASLNGIADEELPVVFYMAKRSKTPFGEIVDMKADGNSWSDISSMISLRPADFYVMVTKEIDNSAYTDVLKRFKDTPEFKWNEIVLTDKEIVNLVNLKFLYSHHDYSGYEIISKRDAGKSFVTINAQVSFEKAELLKKQAEQLAAQEKNKNTLEAK